MSGDPQLCSTLLSDGFDGESPDKKSRLFAISSDFELGFARMKRLITILRPLAVSSSELTAGLDDTLEFLEAHRNRYLLLETIELDCMTSEGEEQLRRSVEEEIKEILRVGAAIDALPTDTTEAEKL